MKYQRALMNLDRGLTRDQLITNFPSLYADDAHVSRSDKYVFISTAMIIDAMSQHGLVPTQVMQALPRRQSMEDLEKPLKSGKMRKVLPRLADERDQEYLNRIYLDRVAHTSHLVRFGRPRVPGATESMEVILRNAQDGTMSYVLDSGYVRYICQNGQVAGDFGEQVRFMHIRTHIEEIIEGTFKILQDQRLPRFIELMKQTPLSRDEELILAHGAMKARFESAPRENIVEGTATVLHDEEEEEEGAKEMELYRPEQFIQRFHYQDQGNHDLDTVMNAAQEALVTPQRRVVAYSRDERGRRHTHTLRDVNDINTRVKVTKRIMSIAEQMAAVKNGMTFEQLQSYLKG